MGTGMESGLGVGTGIESGLGAGVGVGAGSGTGTGLGSGSLCLSKSSQLHRLIVSSNRMTDSARNSRVDLNAFVFMV